jgi:DUF971 family protein
MVPPHAMMTLMTSPSGADAASPAQDPGLSPTKPLRIHADRAAGTLAIEWADGHRTVYEATPLRWLCPCAFCRGEAGMPGWLDSGPSLTEHQTRLTDIHLVGNYAVSPLFFDWENTVFYTFRLLRERCPCEECTARRDQSTHHHE